MSGSIKPVLLDVTKTPDPFYAVKKKASRRGTPRTLRTAVPRADESPLTMTRDNRRSDTQY